MMTVKHKHKYAVGDHCWIGLGLPELVEARVVGYYTLPEHPTVHYILEVVGTEWPHHEVRDALLMSPTADGALPVWEHDKDAMGGTAYEPWRPPLPKPHNRRH
jgi:hypothetical protein